MYIPIFPTLTHGYRNNHDNDKKEITHVQKNYHKFPDKQHFRKRTDLLVLTQKRKTLNLAQEKDDKNLQCQTAHNEERLQINRDAAFVTQKTD